MVLKYEVKTFYSGTKVSRGPFWHAFSVSSEAIHCLAFPAGTPRMNVAYEIKLTLRILWFSFPGEFHLRLRHLEKSLLQALNDAKGRILDDDRIIATLEKLKQEAAEITRKVEETDAVMAEVEAVSDQYNALSHYCSSIYFTMEGLKLVSHRNPILMNKKCIVRHRRPKSTVDEFCKMF